MRKKLRMAMSPVLFLAVLCMMTGCGVNHKSPEGVVESLVRYYEKGKEKKVLNCYGLSLDEDAATQEEVEETIAYFQALGSDGLSLEDCDVIQEYEEYTYMYVYYLVSLEDGGEYPRMSTYFVRADEKKYDVMPTKDITSEMSEQAEEAYATFMISDEYTAYAEAYESFVQENPTFEEELAQKLR